MTIHQISPEGIDAAMKTMPAAEKRQFLERLNAGAIEQITNEEAATNKMARFASIRAARVKSLTDQAAANELNYLTGMLKRSGLPPLEVFAEEGPVALDSLMAATTRPLTIEQRLEVKGRLHALGLA
jgi:hypothetical protein